MWNQDNQTLTGGVAIGHSKRPTAAVAGSARCRSAATIRSARTSSSARLPTTTSPASRATCPLRGSSGRRGEAEVFVGGGRPDRLGSVPGAAAPGLRVGRLYPGAVRPGRPRQQRWRRSARSVRWEATYSGWFLGSGYEYGFGFMPGLFWKTEYRFADYSADVLPVVVTATGAPTGNIRRLAEIRADHPQRVGLPLQLRRPGGRALLIEATFEMWKAPASPGPFAFPVPLDELYKTANCGLVLGDRLRIESPGAPLRGFSHGACHASGRLALRAR